MHMGLFIFYKWSFGWLSGSVFPGGNEDIFLSADLCVCLVQCSALSRRTTRRVVSRL